MAMSSAVIQPENPKVGKSGDVLEFDLTDFQHTPVGKLIIYRLVNNYDVKIVITGDVGDGKTALAVTLARWVRQIANGIFDEFRKWDVEDHAGLDVMKYLQAYKESQPGDALVIDELQEAADKRRAMANEAVWLSWAWMKLRVMQVVSIGVMPTASVLDGRLEELTDIWIHVARRGHAHPYYLHTNPFPPYKTYRLAFEVGDYRQYIRWPDLAGDPEYERLHEMKEETGVPGIDSPDHYSKGDVNEKLREANKERVQRALDKLHNGGIDTQSDLAEIFEIHKGTVSEYKREMEGDV